MTTRPSRRARLAAAAAALVALVATGCEVPGGAPAGPEAARVAPLAPVTTASAATSTTTSTLVTSTSLVPTTATPSTTSVPPTTATTLLAPPRGLVDAVQARLGDPRFAGTTVGLSVWVEGSGEIVAAGAGAPLRPGSTEKLLVAAGALAVLGPDATLATEVKTAAPVEGAVVHGDLVLVGGGDPSLGFEGLDALARQLGAAGIREVAGDLVADESRYDAERRAPGWTDRHMPTFVGPLSALAVGRNWVRTDPEYTAEPALGNAGYFRRSLSRAGIAVHGVDRTGTAHPQAVALAGVSSPPVSALVAEMLTRSDNFFAELLLKEIGYQARGQGTTGSGAAASHEAMAALGVTLTGSSADGSGLSRDNSRPPGEWGRLLVAAAEQPWGAYLVEGLPLAGRTGTLEFRFRGQAGEGNVRAKTGSVRESRALSGYLTTAGGRAVTFSLVVNGPTAPAAIGAMDDLVATLAASPA